MTTTPSLMSSWKMSFIIIWNVAGLFVKSHNTHVTLLTTTASSESQHPQLSCPHDLRDSQNLVPCSNSVVTKPRPFPIVYSKVFSHILSLSKPVHIPVF